MYFHSVADPMDTGSSFQFSAPAHQIIDWLAQPQICFDSLNTEYVDIDDWSWFNRWRAVNEITNTATGICDANRELVLHTSQQIYIDQTQQNYWTVYFIVWFQ